MPFDDYELGADAGAWGGFGGDGLGSVAKPRVPSITNASRQAFREVRPKPADVPLCEPYDINLLGEHPTLPAGFVATTHQISQEGLPKNFDPHAIWKDYKNS
jgi:hypothetical protein